METKQAVAALWALAQETRLAVFRLLVQAGPTGVSVGEIAEALKAAAATLSFHLKELTHAGLIEARHDGRFIFYSANYRRMNELLAYLTENCCADDGVSCAAPTGTQGCVPSAADALAKIKQAGARRSGKRRVPAR